MLIIRTIKIKYDKNVIPYVNRNIKVGYVDSYLQNKRPPVQTDAYTI